MPSIYGEYDRYTRLRIDYSISQDIAENISKITCGLYGERTTASQQSATGTCSMTDVEERPISYNWTSSEYELALIENNVFTVKHNQDGTKKITLEGYWNTGRSGSQYIPEELTISQIINLPTIPRASSISCTTADIGQTAIIVISKANPSYTHTISYNFYGLTGTIETKTSNTTISWNIPENFYSKIPTSISGKGTLTCITYSGNTKLGEKTIDFFVNVNKELAKPTITIDSWEDVNPITLALTGNNQTIIQNASNVKIGFYAHGNKYASIKKVEINGITLTQPINLLQLNHFTINKFPGNAITATITDSRNITTNAPVRYLDPISYIPLTFNYSLKRKSLTGDVISIEFEGDYFNGNFGAENNSLTITWSYSETQNGEYIEGGTIEPVILENNRYSNGNSPIELGNIFDYHKQYYFKLQISDKITTLNYENSVLKSTTVFDWGEDFFDINTVLYLLKEKGNANNLEDYKSLLPKDDGLYYNGNKIEVFRERKEYGQSVKSISAGSWQDYLTSNFSVNTEAGDYLLIFSYKVQAASSSGVTTGRILVDDTESNNMFRQTVPINSNVISSAQIIYPIKLTKGTHKFMLQQYSTVALSTQDKAFLNII